MTTQVEHTQTKRAHPVSPLVGCSLIVVLFAVGSILVLMLLRNHLPWDSTGIYPIDYFSEMHYQKSHRTSEPPRPLPPQSIVPVTGRAPFYSPEEMQALQNPLPDSQEVRERGQQVFAVNCSACHGEQADGNGRVAPFFRVANAPPPADLTSQQASALSDGALYQVITDGLGQYMPPFGNLLTDDERWAVIRYLRAIQ
jgi:mono/diheme cytochrome c family protein